MKMLVNGKEIDTSSVTVAELLSELGIISGRVAVEVNLSIVRKNDYVSFSLNEGDAVEIVNFVGGGLMRQRKVVRRQISDVRAESRSRKETDNGR